MTPTTPSRRTVLAAAGLSALAALTGCGTGAPAAPPTTRPSPTGAMAAPATAAPDTSASGMAARATVPVLCWHQLRDHRPGDSASSRSLYVCPPATFRSQLDGIRAAGHTPIGPDDYLAHLTTGAALPPRPVMLSFDDSQGSQIVVGLPELQRRQMTATFFVQTVPLGKPNWMSRADVRDLHDVGMTVGAHTYDHHPVGGYSGSDWTTQLDRPRRVLEQLTGAPVRHFAYPYGTWDPAAFAHLDEAGYRTAFQLGDWPLDVGRPLLTLRRILARSEWDGDAVVRELARPV
jgi:peptidoglycan/xylan/chitin deacetylase (PgdA/CDA1 family)